MSGDFTRNTFRRALQYRAVRLQQGRVLMDADWNEQVDITRWIERRTSADVIGPCGFPQGDAGFALFPVAGPAEEDAVDGEHVIEPGRGDLAISAGRAYVGGLLVENPEPALVALARAKDFDDGTYYRIESGPVLELGQPLVIVGRPELEQRNTRVIAVAADEEGGLVVRLSPNPEFEELEAVALAAVGAQPHLIEETLPEREGRYLAYLEVWERPIGVLEDPTIAEVALGGPDTAQRDQVIWQVKLMLLGGGTPTCKLFGPAWGAHHTRPALLAARALAESDQADPCALPAGGGYRSLENHLYRVEVHNGGFLGDDRVTVKWSRDNAMHRTRLLEVSEGALVVESPGKDETSAFRTDDWLEVLDEARILDGRPGFFVKLGEVNGDRLGVAELRDPDTLAPLTDNGQPDLAKVPSIGIVRRWEGGPPFEADFGADAWTPLEKGVEIRLESGSLTTGDYWTVPARSIPADVEWPAEVSSGAPIPLPPEGIVRRFCALGIVDLHEDGSWTVREDCRRLFPPLTLLETFHYLGGDGQEATPDPTRPNQRVPLDATLRVGVSRGTTPVRSRLVRFHVEDADPSAALAPAPRSDVVSATDRVLVVRTDDMGMAEAELALHPRRQHHHVIAELLDASDPMQADRAHLAVRFTANLSTAEETAYDPRGCEFQRAEEIEPGVATTVQQALDKLCPAPQLRLLSGDGQILARKKFGPEPIRLGLWWGKAPLEGAKLRLNVASGNADVVPELVEIGPDGTAEAMLVGGFDVLQDEGVVLVDVTPVDLPVAPQPRKLRLRARYLNADNVYADPDVCPKIEVEGEAPSVAAILRHLCSGEGGEGPGLHVTDVRFRRGNLERTLVANSIIEPRELSEGLRIELDGMPDDEAFRRAPVGKVVFDQPHPLSRDEREILRASFDNEPFLHQETEILGNFAVLFDNDQRAKGIAWFPTNFSRNWLLENALAAFSAFKPRARPARLVIYGSRVWQEGDPSRLLDGDLSSDPTVKAGVAYPSGDGVRGGDLVLPFQLGSRSTIGRSGSRLTLIPVASGPLFGTLTSGASVAVARAMAHGIDRPGLDGTLPANARIRIGTTRAKPAAVRKALAQAQIADRPITILAHKSHQKLLVRLVEQYRSHEFRAEPKLTSDQNAIRAFRSAIDSGSADAVLVAESFEENFRADPARAGKLGKTTIL